MRPFCALGLIVALCGGCITTAHKAISVQQVPPELLAPSRGARVAVDFTLLQQDAPVEHLVGPGDTLGIYVENLFPAEQQMPMHFSDSQSPRYPGQTITPRVGAPVLVDPRGFIKLPMLPPLGVEGLTLSEVSEAIRKAATDAKILKPGKEIVVASLLKPRFVKVTVIRDDVDGTEFTRKDSYVLAKRGSARVLEMPVFENDVLHALAATGGLPGADAFAHLWVIRAQLPAETAELLEWQDDGEILPPLWDSQCPGKFRQIPLQVYPDNPRPFSREDVVLHDGDVVYVPSRETEFFYVGGYLSGGQIPLPRDYDLDVLGAIALANGSVAGPAGERFGANAFRSGPGNIIPPSRVIIVRPRPNGGEIKIAVNLKRALNDARERIVIQPGDLVMVQFTIPELLGNVALNFVNFGFTIPNR